MMQLQGANELLEPECKATAEAAEDRLSEMKLMRSYSRTTYDGAALTEPVVRAIPPSPRSFPSSHHAPPGGTLLVRLFGASGLRGSNCIAAMRVSARIECGTRPAFNTAAAIVTSDGDADFQETLTGGDLEWRTSLFGMVADQQDAGLAGISGSGATPQVAVFRKVPFRQTIEVSLWRHGTVCWEDGYLGKTTINLETVQVSLSECVL